MKVTQEFQNFNALSNFDKLYNKRIDWKPVVAANAVISKTPINMGMQGGVGAPNSDGIPPMRSPQL